MCKLVPISIGVYVETNSMVFLLVALIFLFSMLLVGCLVFPARFIMCRDRLVVQLHNACRIFLKLCESMFFSVFRSIFRCGINIYKSHVYNFKYHRAALVSGMLVLILPPLLVVLFRGPVRLEGYEGTSLRAGEPHSLIASLLQGERLAPPRPLPPQVFISIEVERIRPRISSADRSWEKLDAEFTQRLLVVYKIMQDRHGYQMALLEGYRSPEKQGALSPSVTSAGAGQSYHQYGLAADSAFLRDGKLVISEKDTWAMKGYELYGLVAEEVGLTWGGRWKLLDFGHVEYRRSGSGPPKRR
jgi:peptidoglycan L-alanyl-D-glutamate endopeptidase CwlK